MNPSPFRLGADFNSPWAPSYRQIIDVGDWDNSRFMHTTGQSGNVFSGHYADLIPTWQKVEYAPMRWTRAIVEKDGVASKLALEPGAR